VSALLRRLAGWIGQAAPGRVDGAPRLGPTQRAWLLKDIGEDLAAMIDDAENRGVTERGAKEMLVIRALVGWLEGGAPPGAEAIGYLERAVKAIPRDPDEDELALRTTYLGAIGELGGDEESAAGLWREPYDERTRLLLDFQGRKLRGRMEELGLTIAELAGKSEIDPVRLVAVLSGQEEMRGFEWTGLSEALDVPLDWMIEGIRFVPRTGEERGSYEIEPEEGRPPGVADPSDGLGGDPR
jgi:hypothetical protein